MSYINFESAKLKDDLRNEKRKAREVILEKAEAAYKKRKDREQRAHERGEDKWMLPSLDAQLQGESKKTEKKHKKEKKKKRDKKQKSKSKKDSSGSSDSSDAEEWVEKGEESSSGTPSAPAQRDSWMTLPALFPCVSRDQIRAQKRQETPLDEETMKKKFLLDNPGQSERELNPFWKDGGKGLPQVEEPQPDSLSLPTNSAGDHGLAWLRRALRRVQEQAKEEGRSEEAVASERWGSLAKLKSMLSEAERRCRTKSRDGGRGRSHRGGRVQGPAPRPREYEDWREDPTAGESANSQSEAVGDKSRYRSWLGLKDPSPQKEPSSDEEDDFDCNQLDDPPTVEGMVIKESNEENNDSISVVKKDCSEDDDNDDDDEADGKILFRSSKTRKRNLKCDVKDGLHPFGRKLAVKSTGKQENEIDSEDDDKLFEEWRNERMKKDSDESDKELENIKTLGARKETEIEKKTVKTPTDKQHIDNSRGSEGNSKKMFSSTSLDFQEKLNQIQNKDSTSKSMKEEKDVKNRRECEYRESSHEHDLKKDCVMMEDLRNANKERRGSDEELKMQKVDRNGRERYRDYRYRDRERNEGEYGKGKERDEQKLESFYKDRERASEEKSRNREIEEDKSKSEHRREFYDERRTKRASESRQVIRDGGRRFYEENKFTRRRDEHDDPEYRDRQRTGRDPQAGPRRSDVPDYLRKQRSSPSRYEKNPPRRLGGFRKPEEDASGSQRHSQSDILGNAITIRESSSGKKNWMKKEFQENKRKVEPKPEIVSQKSESKPLIPAQKVDVKEKEEEKDFVPMSDADMNALGAKVLKAELLGNHDLAARLKKQLEQAQTNRQRAKIAPIPGSVTSKPQDEEVLLTRRDAKGFVRPVGAPSHSEPTGGRRRPQHVATHGADGLRERFFPDDDKYSLENMFQKEKLTTIEDANEEFSRLASKSAGRAENEYDLDDIFAEKMSREKAPGKLQALERNHAIREHKRVERSLDSCTRCFDSPRMLKHLLIALGSKVYLSLPAHQSLTEGHCLLAPIHHVPCATQLDEDVWEEMTSFRKALVSMFSKEDQDCVFYESAMHMRRFPHMVLECVPLPREVGDTAPIYFKKAIMESEMEWSMNKKLVDLKGKGVRRAVPKGLPYFAVDFGNDDGFAHVIEDEKLFPENFAQEIIGGMLDLDHSLWRKKRLEDFNTQRKKVLQFAELWKRFDVTKSATLDSSSSSSESDRD